MTARVRRHHWFSLFMIVALLLGACVPNGAPAAGEPATAAQPAAGEQAAAALPEGAAPEQVLRMAVDSGPGNGPVPGLDFGVAGLPGATYWSLMHVDGNGEFVPALATNFDVNAEQTEFIYHLNPAAVWSDGEPLTAQQIVDWYNFIWHPDRISGPSASNFNQIKGWVAFQEGRADTLEGVVAVDDQTLQITLEKPGPAFRYSMATIYAAPGRVEQYADVVKGVEAGKAQYEAMSQVWTGDNAANLIVSGPFKFETMRPEPEGVYNFVVNPNWWGAPPKLTRIENITMRDHQTFSLMFENEELDLAYVVGPAAVNLRQMMPDVFKEKRVWAFFSMFFYTDREPSDDLNLRKALLHAIEWEKVAAVAWEGEQPPIENGQTMPPGMNCRPDDWAPYPFDVAKAKEYLAQSTYGPTGTDVPKIRLRLETDAPRQRASQIIAEMWRTNLGIEDIEMHQEETEFTEGAETIAIRTASSGAAFPDPGVWLGNVFRTGTWTVDNGTHYRSDEWDEEIDAIRSMDPTAEGYCQAVQAFYQKTLDQALLIPMAYIKSWRQEQPWLMNFDESQVSNYYNLHEVWIAEQ